MLEYWLCHDERLVKLNIFGHDVLKPNLLEVLPIEDRDFSLHLGEEPGLQRVEQFAFILQVIEHIAFAELGAGLRK